ncbi:MAG TPA: hypothetical protein VJU82_16075, partial [Acidobacteriaceae bacterium]|nr:hypothetical protein [Acidobacteriaceae bacterium]
MAMVCAPYWITPKLAIVPRPRGGDWLNDEMAAIRTAGIDVLVSTLEFAEARDLGLEREEVAAREAGLRFVSFPIQDRSIPGDLPAFERLLGFLERSIREGKRVGVHCRACIGRS